MLGGYLLLFPKNRVRVLPAAASLLCRRSSSSASAIVIQLISGVGTIGANTAESGGVAYMAHIGGFAARLLLVN